MKKLRLIPVLILLVSSIVACQEEVEDVQVAENIESSEKETNQNSKTENNFTNYEIYYMNENNELISISSNEYQNYIHNELDVESNSSMEYLNVVINSDPDEDNGIASQWSDGVNIASIFHKLEPLSEVGENAYRIMGRTCKCISSCSSGCEPSMSFTSCSCSSCSDTCTKESSISNSIMSAASFQ